MQFSLNDQCAALRPYPLPPSLILSVVQTYQNTEANYAYKQRQETCNVNAPSVKGPYISSTDTPYIRVDPYSPTALMAALVKGPVVFSMHVHEASFKNYASGIYYSDYCNEPTNHGMYRGSASNYWHCVASFFMHSIFAQAVKALHAWGCSCCLVRYHWHNHLEFVGR